MSGSLTTHVLDTANGRPAAGVKIELCRVGRNGEWKPIKTAVTNADGRTDEPLLGQEEMEPGIYEAVFHVGEYFSGLAEAQTLPDPPFLDRVPVRFGVADARDHYHVPLLASPWSYSTYRGS